MLALIAVIGIVLILREYGKTKAMTSQAQAEQAKMNSLLAILRGRQQIQLAETQSQATAKDWLSGIQAVGEAVASIAGSEFGAGSASGG